VLATVTFGSGSGWVGGGTFNIATVAAAINRTSSGFARGTGGTVTTQTVDIFACAPNRRTPTGTPDTATAAQILGGGLTLDNARSTNVQLNSAAGLLRTALTEDPQPVAASVSGPAGTWLATAGGLNGTRVSVTLTGVPSGINVYVLRSLSTMAVNPTTPVALVTITGGPARFTRVGGAESDASGGGVGADIQSQFDRVPTVGDTVTVVYEFVEFSTATPLVSAVRFPIVFTGNPPIALGNISGTFGLGPVGPPTKAQGRPQFQAAPAAVGIARTLACQSYLLFPWVVHRTNGSFSTGLAIANTSMDPITGPSTTPAVPHTGDVTLNFYRSRSADGANPAAVKIATALEGGRTATYIMSQLTPEGDFDGYVIAYCSFAFGHGFAFINSPSPGSGGQFAQGYLGIALAVDRDFSANAKTESAGN